MANSQSRYKHIYEVVFVIYANGWVLDEFAAIIEHGWEVHSQSLWSFLDATFTFLYGFYGAVRIYSLFWDDKTRHLAMGLLITAAPVLLARMAFSAMPCNIVFICLHAVMRDFAVLTALAIWCFAGFLLALYWLAEGDSTASGEHFGYSTIAKWLLWLWFGLDGTGIEQSPKFHSVLGPTLIIAFVFLGNTLFLTILVATLTNKFSGIIANENAEILFRQSVLTFAGVKSDSIFAYPPPFNLLALAILTPLRYILTRSDFHKINVQCVQIINTPTLLLIALYDRHYLWKHQRRNAVPKRSYLDWRFTGFSPHGDIQAVFRANAPKSVQDAIDELEDMSEDDTLENVLLSRSSRETSRAAIHRRKMSNGSGTFVLPSARL